MSSAASKKKLSDWVSENRIPVRIGSLSAVMLCTVIISALVMSIDLTRNQSRVKSANEGFHRLELAATADQHFSLMRYWLTDLSVSLLTISERFTT